MNLNAIANVGSFTSVGANVGGATSTGSGSVSTSNSKQEKWKYSVEYEPRTRWR
jgi:hypothetical protein